MRLLITTSTFPVKMDDGIPRFVFDLAQALSSHAEVCVLAPDAPGAARRERLGAIDVHRFSYFWPRSKQCLAVSNRRGMRDNLRASFLAKAQVPLFMSRQASVVRKLVRQNQIDVINAHWLVPQGLTAAWALRGMPQVKLALHIHAADVYLLQKMRLGARIARYVVRRADAIFADGSHVRDALNELLGYDSQAVLQPMGVHGKLFCSQAEISTEPKLESELVVNSFPEGYILFVGRLVEKKGTIYLIRAMEEIRRERPGVGLVIAGYGPEEKQLRREVVRLNLDDQVQFVGNRSHAQIVKLLHNCRVAAVPSIIDRYGETEGMPTVVVESLAAGVPVVGSNVNGIPDVIRHTENGWLCREKDSQDLAEKLLLALDCDRARYAQQAQATANGYDWEQVAINYLERIHTVSGAVLTGAV